MQTGAWAQAQDLLRGLSADFPQEPRLRGLTQEMAIKAQVDASWAATAGKPRLFHNLGRWLRWLAGLTILFAILAGAARLYRDVVAPQQLLNAAASTLQKTLDQGATALAANEFEAAMAAYEQALSLDPGNAAAQEGLAQVQQQLVLQRRYEEALAQLQAGERAAAIAALEQLQADAPGFRDVGKRLAALQDETEIAHLYSQANAAFQAGEWAETIRLYENLRSRNSDYRSAEVDASLAQAYRAAADEALSRVSEDANALGAALDPLRRLAQLRPTDRAIVQEITALETFQRGQEAIDAGNGQRGLDLLLPMYEKQPDFLHGALAAAVYRGYLLLGDALVQQGDRLQAFAHYSQAAGVAVADKGEAKLRMEAVGVGLTPTPTPTPTATPTITPAPSVTVAPTATPPPIHWFKGWIAFRSDRDGRDGLYVMRPDGSGQRPVDDAAKEWLAERYEQERWSPDGTTRIFAAAAPGGGNKDVNLYIFRADLPANWERQFMYTDWGGQEYDPVWSPSNYWIAFVANHTGNDEIWIMRSDGSDKRQLTHNDWEWDKHPTWAPDSGQISFFSNRSGANQIWLMNADGSGQRNLSNNIYNDSDPVWLK